jgi:hypothetical protein
MWSEAKDRRRAAAVLRSGGVDRRGVDRRAGGASFPATATIGRIRPLRASVSAKCEKRGRRRRGRWLIYPHLFSPGWWLQPGLKGGL